MDNRENNEINELNSTSYKKHNKGKRISTILTILSVIFLVTGIVFLLIDPIKSFFRGQIRDGAMDVIESQISLQESDVTAITYIVPRDGNEVTGEEYDYYGDEEDIIELESIVEEEEQNLPKNVTLTCIGKLTIDCIDFEEPIWDSSARVALRYGVGKYEDSVMPGEVGNCSILGHRNRHTSTMFYQLYKVKKGDVVTITTISGEVYTYIVKDVKIVSPDKLIKNIVGTSSKDKQLTLITCATEHGKGYRRLVVCKMQEND